jgi:regulator of nonsense transcripts 3
VEFAPFGRIPNNKRKADARQGTIDLDPDFIAFLESLTDPVVSKSNNIDVATSDTPDKKVEKVTVTPLVQYLKDKKANKGRETSASSSKGSKVSQAESRDGRTDRTLERGSPRKAAKPVMLEQRRAGKESRALKSGKATVTEPIRVLKKDAAGATTSNTASPSSSTAKTPERPLAAPRPERRRERGNASAAARILQRDLGLGGKSSLRRGAKDAASDATKASPPLAEPIKLRDPSIPTKAPQQQLRASASETKLGSTTTDPPAGVVDDAQKSAATGQSTAPKKTTVAKAPPRGPAAQRLPPTNPRAVPPASKNPNAPTAIDRPILKNPSSTAAFLKHANPSQGVTEALLETAMGDFGTVVKVEMDKKKGFAYVDFKEPAGLRKAISGSPIKVGEGQVVVLERDNRGAGRSGISTSKPPPVRGSRGDRGRGGGGSGGRGRGRSGAHS